MIYVLIKFCPIFPSFGFLHILNGEKKKKRIKIKLLKWKIAIKREFKELLQLFFP